MDIIVDGYNLMHAAGLARSSYGPRGLQKARHLLVLRIRQGFQESELQHLLIVFDAKEAPAETVGELRDQGVRIRFAQPGTEADDLIEDLILEHSAPRQLLVVSSDHRLQRAARRRNAAYVDSDQFLDDLERRQKQIELEKRHQVRQVQQQSPSKPPVSIDEWLQEFGEIDVDELSQQIEAESRSGSIAQEPGAGQHDVPAEPLRSPSETANPNKKNRERKSRKSPGRGTPSVRSQEDVEPSSNNLPDEEKFWQDRIDELFDEEGW